MKVELSRRYASDKAAQAVAEELRHCVECGAANSVCATYQVLNDENDSPRGRNRLIRDLLASDEKPLQDTIQHIDQCLSCNACTGTCMAQVDFRRVMDHAREVIEEAQVRPFKDRLFRKLLGTLLPNPRLFRVALFFGRIGAPIGRLIPGRIGALARQAQLTPPTGRWQAQPKLEAKKGTVAILDGCVNGVLGAHINAATERVLNKMGYSVAILPAGCCGAFNFHMGERGTALGNARKLLTQWQKAEDESTPFSAIIVNASGCGSLLKDWEHLFEGQHEQQHAARYASLTQDVTEFIDPKEVAQIVSAQKKGKVAFHPPCSLQHAQKILINPEALLRACGFEIVRFRERDLCCGSAGAYSMLHPELSERIRDRKVSALEDSGAGMIASANIGCITQIGQGTSLPVLHVVELIDWALGGPRPKSLSGMDETNE